MPAEEPLPGGFIAEAVRALHDACAGTELAGDAETVCHRDLSPKNTVYRDSPEGPLPVAPPCTPDAHALGTPRAHPPDEPGHIRRTAGPGSRYT